jgi:hypothetical protein
MSKMDNLRAMREARYEAAAARAGQAGATKAARPPVAPARVAVREVAEPVAGAGEAAGEEQCGHRNMSGRTCTRERGHAAKSHRYS